MVNSDKVSVLNVNEASDEVESDIGERMKERAMRAYGVRDFLKNIELLSSDGSENDVKYLWYWLDCVYAYLAYSLSLSLYLSLLCFQNPQFDESILNLFVCNFL